MLQFSKTNTFLLAVLKKKKNALPNERPHQWVLHQVFPKGAILSHFILSYSCHVINRNLERIIGNFMAERQMGKKGTSRHQCHNKVSSTEPQFLRGIFGHELSPSVTHRPKHNEDTVQTFSCDVQLTTKGFLANEQYHRHLPYKPYCWRRERDKQEEVAPQSTWEDLKGILPVLQHP